MFVKPNDTIALILLLISLCATLAAIIFCRQFRPTRFFSSTTTTTTTTTTTPSVSSSPSYEYTDEYTMSSAQLPAEFVPSPGEGHVQDPLSPHDDNEGAGRGLAGGPDRRGYSYVTSASSASSDSVLGTLNAVEEGHRDGTTSASVSLRREED